MIVFGFLRMSLSSKSTKRLAFLLTRQAALGMYSEATASVQRGAETHPVRRNEPHRLQGTVQAAETSVRQDLGV